MIVEQSSPCTGWRKFKGQFSGLQINRWIDIYNIICLIGFVCGELDKCSFQLTRYNNIMKYLLKITLCSKMKYVRIVYNMLHNDCINFPNKVTWVTLLRNSLDNIGFMDVWWQQSVGS